jgi:capsular polysaccharide transport system permease protein
MTSVGTQVYNRVKNFPPLFWLCVGVPTFLATLYYAFLSSNTYVSESRFVVRSPEKQNVSGLGGLFKSAGFANSEDDAAVTKEYLLSRDALHSINTGEAYRKANTSSNIGVFDRFNPLGTNDSFEALYKYYLSHVKVESNGAGSVITLNVSGYSPEDAQKVNARLLDVAEASVNRMSDRGHSDTIRLTTNQVEAAKSRAYAAANALSHYRNAAHILDPEKQALLQSQMVTKLQDDLIATKTQIYTIKSSAPHNPQLPSLQAREAGLAAEIAHQLQTISGGNTSLASSLVTYQRLTLESQIADKQLASALQSLQEAQDEALRKRAYLERITSPSLSDYPAGPRRLTGIAEIFALGMVVWAVLSMLFAGVREHKDI